MYIWLLISKAERQAAGAKAKANAQNPTDICMKSGRNTPQPERRGGGFALSTVARQRKPPSPAFRLAY